MRLIFGRRGADTYQGSEKSDLLFGGRGDDRISGGGGADLLDGGAGHDTLLGGTGADMVFGGSGNDRIEGEEGSDVLVGGSGADTVLGGAGDDLLQGDALLWGGGDDILDGGAGNDLVYGDASDDRLLYTAAENVGARDAYIGGQGSDTLVLTLSRAEFAGAADDLTGLDAHIASGSANGFAFSSLGLTVWGIEAVEVILTDTAPTLTAGALSVTLGEDDTAGATVSASGGEGHLSYEFDLTGLRGAVTDLGGGSFAYDASVFGYLVEGETATDTFAYTVTDETGQSVTETITVTVTGLDDAAAISGDAAGAVVEDQSSTASGQLLVSDADAGQAVFQAPVGLEGAYGRFAFDAATGAWSYEAGAAAQALGAGESVAETLTVTSLDGSASETITITLSGANDGAVISGDAAGALTTAQGSVSGVLSVADADAGEAGFASLDASELQGTYGRFAFDEGRWTYTLDAGATLGEGITATETLTVTSFDGSASETISVDLTGLYTLDNGSFEDGTFFADGWDMLGFGRILSEAETEEPGFTEGQAILPTDGGAMVQLSSQTTDAAQLGAFFGVDQAVFFDLLSAGQGPDNVAKGLQQTVTVEAGDTVTFDWFLDDASPFAESVAFLVADGEVIELGRTDTSEGDTGWQEGSWTADEAGTIDIGFGIIGDNGGSGASHLYLDNVEIAG
ncbi:VCBS domain-containing protein [Parvularcula dongshanensis]|uniref:VCBS repeat-containing protein n=1 Tax=Parvularcula dongshanensis TaxID=1173995 RepID=A0A840I774_9PROT|nr:VCBS domain-containing protein [Parvularcula dongshanensis]MBB4660175.1 VCBS repeat-containing protein [Parvularcula dongshanensis]